MDMLEVVRVLEVLAPPRLAAEWDNVGLQVGDMACNVNKVMLCIDATESVLAEAAAAKATMILAYHPVIFKPLRSVTAAEGAITYHAARRGIAVYALHTALDAVEGGTNDVLADVLGLRQRRPLEPIVRANQCKIVAFVPPDGLSHVAEAAFAAGAGRIGNYFDCAFFSHGIGSFCGSARARPTVGNAGRHEAVEEIRLEVVAPRAKAGAVCSAIRDAHAYEAPAIDVYPLDEYPEGCGLGRIGILPRPVQVATVISRIKKATGLKKLLVAPAQRRRGAKAAPAVRTAACGAGSCGPLFRPAAAAGATFYLTGEMRHHDALAATGVGLTVVCLGHSNSERIVLKCVAGHLQQMLPKLKVAISKRDRDPFEIV